MDSHDAWHALKLANLLLVKALRRYLIYLEKLSKNLSLYSNVVDIEEEAKKYRQRENYLFTSIGLYTKYLNEQKNLLTQFIAKFSAAELSIIPVGDERENVIRSMRLPLTVNQCEYYIPSYTETIRLWQRIIALFSGEELKLMGIDRSNRDAEKIAKVFKLLHIKDLIRKLHTRIIKSEPQEQAAPSLQTIYHQNLDCTVTDNMLPIRKAAVFESLMVGGLTSDICYDKSGNNENKENEIKMLSEAFYEADILSRDGTSKLREETTSEEKMQKRPMSDTARKVKQAVRFFSSPSDKSLDDASASASYHMPISKLSPRRSD